MRDAMDFAKFILKKEDPTIANTIDGCRKLQSLLCFANLLSLARYDRPLFSEPVLADGNGFAVESVRVRYRNDYATFRQDSKIFNPAFSQEEFYILNTTLGIFGKLSVRELSILSHEFSTWTKDARERLLSIVNAYERETNTSCRREMINGSTFFIPHELYCDDLLQKLELFSRDCLADSYTIANDNGTFVVY